MTATGTLPSVDRYRRLMADRYQTRHLVKDTPAAFRRRLERFIELRDHAMEGYTDPTRQRDLSIRFHWGHDHDFGDFRLSGRMGERHLELTARFRDELDALPASLEGWRVLDVGCWTGGMSLLFCALGAEVVAIDEVRKYVDCVRYLADAFGLERLSARCMSLYDLGAPEFREAFDLVAFCGVIYHVTDPVLALRHVFNALRDGGRCLLETQATDDEGRRMEYWGPTQFGTAGSAEELNRSGWNWLVPGRGALEQMMTDVGFKEVRSVRAPHQRLLATAVRSKHEDMLRAGLSVPDVT